MLDRTKFHAVDVESLRNLLGSQCSPMRGRKGYVVGPDVTGRFCHCATMFNMSEAKLHAATLNDNLKFLKDHIKVIHIGDDK
jgi:hypothetical protein